MDYLRFYLCYVRSPVSRIGETFLLLTKKRYTVRRNLNEKKLRGVVYNGSFQSLLPCMLDILSSLSLTDTLTLTRMTNITQNYVYVMYNLSTGRKLCSLYVSGM